MVSVEKDIQEILNNWEYQPGVFLVRKIIGDDGKEKIQVRVNLGILQMEIDGRPDGKTPYNAKSLLDYYLSIIDELVELDGSSEGFTLTEKDMKAIDAEIMQYYYRRVCLFALKDYALAKRDAEHNLRLMDIIKKYSKDKEYIESHEKFRSFVIIERARAGILECISSNDHAGAMKYVNEAIDLIEPIYREQGFGEEELKKVTELNMLKRWRSQIHQDWEGGIVEIDEDMS